MNKKLQFLSLILLSTVAFSQNISFTFENARNTNDGSNDYYEADIYIASDTDIIVGSGQIYFNYNTEAFGENVHTNSNFEMIRPDGSILATTFLGGAVEAYASFIVNDNTVSRVSTSFQQLASSGTTGMPVINSTSTHLYSIKIKYADISKDAEVSFETGAVFLDQFFTACGPTTAAAFGTADCTNNAGVQITGDSYDSTGAVVGGTLSNEEINFTGVQVYPNPSKDFFRISGIQDESQIQIFNLRGQELFKVNVKNHDTVNTNSLKTGIYILQVKKEAATIVRKLIIE